MLRGHEAEEPGSKAVGLQQLLSDRVRATLRDSPEIQSLALGDGQGLPVINATKGGVAVMTFTAMATMSLRAAGTASEAVGLGRPEHLLVHSIDGDLVIMALGSEGMCLVALLKPSANLGFALLTLRSLGKDLVDILQR